MFRRKKGGIQTEKEIWCHWATECFSWAGSRRASTKLVTLAQGAVGVFRTGTPKFLKAVSTREK